MKQFVGFETKLHDKFKRKQMLIIELKKRPCRNNIILI